MNSNGMTTGRWLLAAVLMTLLSACGGGGGSSDSADEGNGDTDSGEPVPDTTPEAFMLGVQTNAELSTQVLSGIITVAGIDSPAPISITDGEYAIDEGDFTEEAGTIEAGQTVQVRLTSSDTPATTTAATLTIGGVSAGFEVTTVGPPQEVEGFELSQEAIRTLRFSWTDSPGSSHYKLMENPDGESGFTQVGSDIPQGTETLALEIPLLSRFNAEYLLQSCNSLGCVDSSTLTIDAGLNNMIGYIKPDELHHAPFFGSDVSLSADGNTMAVGAGSARQFTGGGGNKVGIVYVFTKTDVGHWQLQQRLRASNFGSDDGFGGAVSLSADGNTLVIGASREDSASAGINGDGTDNSSSNAGAAYIFTLSDGTWTEQAYLKASNTGASDNFGHSVSISDNGSIVAIGAFLESSSSSGVNGEDNNDANRSGAVYVFSREGETWQQDAFIKASNVTGGDRFGVSVSLDGEAQTLAIGSREEDNGATGVTAGLFTGNDVAAKKDSGAVYVFTRDGSNWTQEAYIKASNAEQDDHFGKEVSLSRDGNSLAVAATEEDSLSTGINGDQEDNNAVDSGAVYVFSRTEGLWAQQAYLKASNTDAGDGFGTGLSLSENGDVLAVGATSEASNATGINGNEFDNTAASGAAYVFRRTGSEWAQHAYLKATNTDAGDGFGVAISLSSDGETLAVAANAEDGTATGTQASAEEQADNDGSNTGVVYLY